MKPDPDLVNAAMKSASRRDEVAFWRGTLRRAIISLLLAQALAATLWASMIFDSSDGSRIVGVLGLVGTAAWMSVTVRWLMFVAKFDE